MKKRLALHKIGGLAIFTFISITFILGVLYNHFCTERIAVRERHLAAVYRDLTPPKNAELIEEMPYGKQFSRTHYAAYRSEHPREELMSYYRTQFKTQGYEMTQTRDEITAQKNGVIVIVLFVKNEVHIHIRFNDIFQKLSI